MPVFLKEISDYFEFLATHHVDVAHGNSNKAFCRYADNEQFNQLRNSAAKNILVVKGFFGIGSGDYEDAQMRNTVVVCISSYAASVQSPAIVAATEQSLEILLSIMARMRNDFEDDNCSWLKNVDFENIQFDEIEQPWLQHHYGWDLIIPFKTTIPAHDETKWTD